MSGISGAYFEDLFPEPRQERDDIEIVRLHGRRVDFDRDGEELGHATVRGGHSFIRDDSPPVQFWTRPDWHTRALCRGTMHDGMSDWFAEDLRSAAARRARSVCRRCPVAVPCHDAGVDQEGIWGQVPA